jgi:hypothetical protein
MICLLKKILGIDKREEKESFELREAKDILKNFVKIRSCLRDERSYLAYQEKCFKQAAKCIKLGAIDKEIYSIIYPQIFEWDESEDGINAAV